MDANTTRNVTDLLESDRQSLEHLLGAPLSSAQRVHIVAYTPGQEPDPVTRARAADEIETMLDRGAANAKQLGVTDAQIDEAVDEAMHTIRRQNTP
ncbi:MAG: hypothetical protein WD971_00245 [Pirellulales bacterium]